MERISPWQPPHCGSDSWELTPSASHQIRTERPRHHGPLQYDAVCLVFDEFRDKDGDPYGIAPRDVNTYTTNRIGDSNVVLALLRRMRKSSAASAAASLKLSYTGLRQTFLAGICGGVPRTQGGINIMLGDMVISKTIIQYDFGKRYPDRFFRKHAITEAHNHAAQGFLVVAETMRGRDKLRRAASKIIKRLHDNSIEHRCGTQYVYPGLEKNGLFRPSYRYKHHESPSYVYKEWHKLTSPVYDEALTASCKDLGCKKILLVPRARSIESQGREKDTNRSEGTWMPAIHVGSVASSGTITESGVDRDQIAQKEGVNAFEVEAARIWDELSCLIVKDVSDYADSHKHGEWQSFAAVTAAATMSALLAACSEKQRDQLEDGALTTFPQALDPGDRERALTFIHFVLWWQPQLTKQVSLSPVQAIDARVSSKELFIHILKDRFKDIGTSKIQRGEWFPEDQNRSVRLDLSKPWLSVIRMYMVFCRRNEGRTECPSYEYSGIYACSLSYCQAEKRHFIEASMLSYFATELSTEITSMRAHENHLLLPSSPNAGPMNPIALEHDTGRYRHVQLIDVNYRSYFSVRPQSLNVQPLLPNLKTRKGLKSFANNSIKLLMTLSTTGSILNQEWYDITFKSLDDLIEIITS
ncbi:hypothetical protein V8C42DRAFT_361287 [Trichoderma barbatum]